MTGPASLSRLKCSVREHHHVIVTTTESIEGHLIVRYLAPVAAQVVAGSNFMSDLFAGFSDVLGGRSQTYEDYLASMHDQVTRELESKGAALEANAILAVRYNLESISGKNMQMFMLQAVGTAVVVATAADIELQVAREARMEEGRRAELDERRARIEAAAEGLAGLLSDPILAREASDVLRMYGKDVCAGFLMRRAAELGVPDFHITAEELPDSF